MNSAAIAKPIDLTLGGIASDSAAKIPGTSSAAAPVMNDVHRDREPEPRREREHRPRDADDRADDREHAQAEAGVAQHEARRERDAEEDGDDLRGLRERGDETALELVEAERPARSTGTSA